MKDFSYWNEYEGASEGSGRSQKIWLINPDTEQIGLFKYKKDKTTTDHVSECIAYELAELINLPCAKFELGRYKGNEGSMSYNIVNRTGIYLLEGIYFINQLYVDYDAEQLVDRSTGAKYSLEMIQQSLIQYGVFDEFLKIVVFDFLIGNTDRHQSNWALILENGKYYLSPLYDNSSSLCAYVKESNIERYLGRDLMLWKSLVDTKSKSAIRITNEDIKQPTHYEMLENIHQKYRVETIDFVNEILENVTESSIYGILSKYEDGVISANKKELIKKFLMTKLKMMKNIYFGEEE